MNDHFPAWLGGAITGFCTAIALAWAMMKKLVVGIAHEEFVKTLAAFHAENKSVADGLRKDVADIKEDVAYLRGKFDR